MPSSALKKMILIHELGHFVAARLFYVRVETLSFGFVPLLFCFCSFFFNDTATTEIYTLSLHDALPICSLGSSAKFVPNILRTGLMELMNRSEEHTSELQSPCNLVCRLLLEKTNHVGPTGWTDPAQLPVASPPRLSPQ